MDSVNDTQATEDAEELLVPNREREAITSWRLSQILSLGVGQLDAELLAGTDADLGLMRQLVGQGCPPDLAVRIVR